ncbi:exodeoxyribonuclease VII large subunit [Nocardioides daedukensis]|uniref:Exodeoxyribonuclease 7 large subunit n=1 Tax=Nocardioides daedukensis TaxID=634462 RepID=A0A7Y9S132_9ACTN|nr:exodeoxyribonuclease VII large subunit [Nocardioides daedukensis]NYG60382.1 exodeoxyribonuclease VII large subunit [Nocardioides daedukensis]
MALETSPESPAPLRVIADRLNGWINRLGAVWVEGQVAQVNRRASSNTVFMTLRDSVAEISMSMTCSKVLFDGLNPPLVEGASVLVHARPSFYPVRGTISLHAREIRMVGLGELLARLERRRQLLAAEGLFAAELKRPLPFLPRAIGLITGANSAAERDVLEVAKRRWPGARFRVLHTTVQGPKCVPEVTAALSELEADPDIEVIVIARGGGSVEDLLPFSDEALIRAVHQARTPVVSAIGHEPDTPLLDLVADWRAATPTDAAKRIVPDMAEEVQRVAQARERLRAGLRHWIDREEAALDALRSRPSMADPRNLLADRADEIDQLRDRARRTLRHRLDRAADDVRHNAARVSALSPLATLQRGYAVLQDSSGHVLTSVAGLESGAEVSVRVADGRLHATTTAVDQLEPVAGPTETPSDEDTDD